MGESEGHQPAGHRKDGRGRMTGADNLKRWEPGELREGALMAVENGSYIAKSIGDGDFIPVGSILASHNPDSPTRLLAWVPVAALSKSRKAQ